MWRGIPVMMTPSPFGKHQKLSTKIAHRLLGAIERVGCRECEVAVELDWVVADDLVVRPDIVVCCGGDTDHFIHSPPVVIVEVLSESTATKDRTAKFDLYRAQGVKYYLLVDSADGSYQAYGWHQGSYASLANLPGKPDIFALRLSPQCLIELDLKQL